MSDSREIEMAEKDLRFTIAGGEETIEQLEARIKAIRETQAKEREAKRKSVKIVRTYSLVPAKNEMGFGEKCWDGSIKFYDLISDIVNLEECQAVGINTDSHGRGMTYLFNTLSGCLIGSHSGGHVWLETPGRWSYNKKDDEPGVNFEKTLDRLNEFLVDHPEGGDITQIMREHRGE